jgi:sugar phosphate isomerase/epimerase
MSSPTASDRGATVPETLSQAVLWSATLPHGTNLDERVRAAAAGGFDVLTVNYRDHLWLAEQGRTPESARAWAAGLGVELAVYDSIANWYQYDQPKRVIDGTMASRDEVLDVCEAFGVRTLVAVPAYPTPCTTADLARAFGELCDAAAAKAVTITLEFTPFPPVADLATGWEIVRQAARPNGTLLVDTWHFYRGTPDLDLLASIPGDRIGAVQISDGDTELTMSLIKATMTDRRLPGRGEFDLVSVLRTLRDIGGLHLVGPEVLENALFELPVDDASRLARSCYDAVIEKAFAAPAA